MRCTNDPAIGFTRLSFLLLLLLIGQTVAGGEGDINQQIALLRHPGWRVRKKAAETLGKLGDKRAVLPLTEALKDEDWRVRPAAAEVLGKLGDKRAIEPLVAVLRDTHVAVRTAGAEALSELGWKSDDPVEQAHYLMALKKWDEVLKLGEAAFEPLLVALKDSMWRVRKKAAETLGKLGDKRAVLPLTEALKDEDWRVRPAAKRALTKLQHTGAR